MLEEEEEEVERSAEMSRANDEMGRKERDFGPVRACLVEVENLGLRVVEE